MYDYNKLRGLIKEHFGTLKNYADALGIGTTTLNTRLNNQTPFTQNEILKSKELFKLNNAEEVDEVFFNRL
jgi:cytoskeletal protein RodZ